MNRLFTVLICAVLSGCSITANQARKEAQIDVKWPIYKIEKDNNFMYLLGTIHIGKEEMYPFPKKIGQALKESKYLVTETDATGIMDGDYQQSVNKEMYFLKEDESLNDFLSKGAEGILKQRAEEYNLDYQSLQKYQLWFVMSLFLSAGIDELSADYGVDKKITELADTHYVPNKYLETPKYQIEAMRKVYTEKDADQVIKQIPTLQESQRQLWQLYSDYIQGKFDEQVDQPDDDFDYKQNKILVEDRNKIWVEKFESYIGSGDIYFVAVGVGHLEGESGILATFKKNGFVVKKISE
ncbi:GumN family protein [Neobacillus bataviensis LMG 21833]|uniref:GumN family protein n=1 Tax=Neobacillus bataviensis LMG 21833 TaxID=1117379 RepID=K6D0W6_9BACI|nr:TraB/GumN family protein [Neobacillus bataviensis]EKN66122.1 GumN family protein [Neobacillus bataviensis LMG 21833]